MAIAAKESQLGVRLLRWFSFLGASCTLVATVALAIYVSRAIQGRLIRQAEDKAIRIANHLSERIHAEFIAPTLREEGAIDLEDVDQLARLQRLVGSILPDFGVKRAYLYDTHGYVLYATVPWSKDHRIREHPQYEAALAGTPSSVLRRHGGRFHLDGTSFESDLLETYVPVWSRGQEAGKPAVTGVVEIYQDAAPIMTTVSKARIETTIVVIGTMGFLSAMLFLAVWRAHRMIREKEAAIRAEQAALEARERALEVQVASRGQAIQRLEADRHELEAQVQHSEKMASIGVMAAGIAHEVGNPVAAISSVVQGLLRTSGGGPPREKLLVIQEQLERVSRIVHQLLSFARPAHRDRGPASINDLVRSARDVACMGSRAKGLDVELHTDPDLPPVACVEDQVQQVFLNILLNAFDATPAGGRVDIRTRRDGGLAVIEFQDTGAGMSGEVGGRIFEPFFTTKEPGKGTGLGLSVAWGIVSAHGGRIDVESTPGRGSLFRVSLPIERAAPSAALAQGGQQRARA